MGATDFTTTTIAHRRQSYFSGCMSPSCVPVYEEYTRIDTATRSGGKSHKWRKLINKMVKESKKSIYGSPKRLTFHYDAVSYSQNFDEGNHRDEYQLYRRRCSQVS